MVLLETMNFLHFLGTAWGVGGATLAAILSAKLKKPSQAPLLKEVMPVISKLILFGLLLVCASGIGLIFIVTWPMNIAMLIIKHVTVGALIVNMIFMKISQKRKKSKKARKVSGIIGLLLWYVIIVLSVIV
jgi:hypothetical protein